MSVLEDLKWSKFSVLDDGFVCLVDAMGDDSSIVQAARVSYGKDRREESSAGESVREDRHLIRYLMRHRHTTPFEMAEVKLLVRVPMDCWRQWIRHRTANVNEYSTRYQPAIGSMSTTKDQQWRLQSANNKQGSDGLLQEWPEGWESKEEGPHWVITAPGGRKWEFLKSRHTYIFPLTPGEFLTQWERKNQAYLRRDYNVRLELGVAMEQARKDLPLSTYTEAYWKCDLHNILHFLGLRMDSHAQGEIREYATIIGEQIIAPLFPLVWEAFQDYRMGGVFLSRQDIQAIQCLGVSTNCDIEEVLDQGWEELPEGWDNSRSRERNEFLAKLKKLGICGG